jgi:hypothetical protein
MAKFGNPFGGSKQVWITQTLHGSSNTAIDCYGYRYQANLPVYAIADGRILGTSPSSGSYCYQSVDNSDFKVWYVHTHNWAKAGTVVKKGQKICEIAPKSKNGGYPEHLHLGLTPKGSNIMNYFDRSIPFRTKYSDIANSWFKNGVLNWSLFKDLSYEKNTMSIEKGSKYEFTNTDRLNVRDKPNGEIVLQLPESKKAVGVALTNGVKDGNYNWNLYAGVGWAGYIAEGWNKKTTRSITDVNGKAPVSDCSAQEKQIAEQKQVIDILNKEKSALESKLGLCTQENSDMKAQLDELKIEIEEYKVEIEKIEAQIGVIKDENSRLIREKGELELKLSECQNKLEQGQENFIKKITDWVGNLLRQIFGE